MSGKPTNRPLAEVCHGELLFKEFGYEIDSVPEVERMSICALGLLSMHVDYEISEKDYLDGQTYQDLAILAYSSTRRRMRGKWTDRGRC